VKPITIPTLPRTVCHQSPLREDKTRPILRDLGDSALSIWSRPGLDPTSTLSSVQQQRKDGMAWCSGSFRRLVSHDAMMSRDGWPFPGHVATDNSKGIDKTSPQGSHHLGLLSPYKRAGQGSTTRKKRTIRPDNNKQRKARDRYLKQLPFPLFPLFETWARGSLSHA
jgi:hypothetical protein